MCACLALCEPHFPRLRLDGCRFHAGDELLDMLAVLLGGCPGLRCNLLTQSFHCCLGSRTLGCYRGAHIFPH